LSVFVALLIIVIAVAIIGFAVFMLRSLGQTAEQSVDERATTGAARRPRPTVQSFHVRGETASVVFSVPLGDSEAGTHLTDLLAANAVEYVRERVADGLPLEDVHRIEVSAMRGDHPELLTTVDLPSVGDLPGEAAILRTETTTHDPIAALQAVAQDSTVVSQPRQGENLESIADLVELSSPNEAHMRALGVDTSSMSLSDLVVGLMTVSGYQVDPGPSGFRLASVPGADVRRVARGSDTAVLAVIEHEAGSYPELDDQILAEFAVAVAQTNPKRAILVTDKFGPYAMYERERRDKRLVFVTRERLQVFVDSFGL